MESLNKQIGTNGIGLTQEPARTLSSLQRWLRTHLAQVLLTILLTGLGVQLVSVIFRKSVTLDELVLIPSAYYYLVTDDFDLVREHPPLCKILSGLPVLFIQPNELRSTPGDRTLPKIDLDWKYEMQFWQDNRERADMISFWSRVPMIGLSLGVGWLIFVFARDFFGQWAALLSVVLFSLEPTILAHARVVQTDMPATFGFLLTAFALHRYLRAPTWKLAIGLGSAVSLAMLAKFSMITLPPLLFIVFIALLWLQPHRRRSLAVHASIVSIVVLVIINAAYIFHSGPLTETDLEWVATSFPSSHSAVLTSVRVLRFLIPTDFLMGVYWQLHHSNQGHPASLLGMYNRMGWWYYYPVAFLLKTTIPFLLVSLVTLGWAVYGVLWKGKRSLLVLLLPFGLYSILMMLSPIDIGIRYFLPAYPFLFILSGGMLIALLQRPFQTSARIVSRVIVVIAFAWMTFEAVSTYPNYIPYMNQFASARPHWWYLSDSNIEWGDDIKELAAYLRARGETRVRTMALGDFVALSFYGVDNLSALSPPEASPPRYTVIGASFLNGSTVPEVFDGRRLPEAERINAFDSFRQRTPEAVIGNSIYVYRMRD